MRRHREVVIRASPLPVKPARAERMLRGGGQLMGTSGGHPQQVAVGRNQLVVGGTGARDNDAAQDMRNMW